MYEDTECQILMDKLDYEVWLLGFLAQRQDMFEGGTDISLIKLTSDRPNAEINICLTDHVGTGLAQSITDAMMPLIFTASYKMLDMIFEWILEENHRSGNISKVPWSFRHKLTLLENRSALQFPPLFRSHHYLHDYSEALFRRLLPYRNAIVHETGFSVSSDTLTLSSSRNNDSLTLSRIQIGCFVRFVIALVRALAGGVAVETYMDGKKRAKLSRVLGKRALKSFHSRLFNVRFLTGESWSVSNGRYCRNQTASSCR